MQNNPDEYDNNREHEFKDALQRFRAMIVRDSKIAQDFAEACPPLQKQLQPDWIEVRSGSGEFRSVYEFFWREEQVRPNILYYLSDAIELYETRDDEYRGTTALLFDPACIHIKGIRGYIALLKDSKVAVVGSAGYNAAIELERALNEVQEKRYIPKTAKIDDALLRVTGYSSGEDVKPHGKGIVAREYGYPVPSRPVRRLVGPTVFEGSVDAMVPHMYEPNALEPEFHARGSILDVRVIDGNRAYQFNLRGGSTNFLEILYSQPVAGSVMAKFATFGLRAISDLSEEGRQLARRELLPYLTEQCPSQVPDLLKKRGDVREI